MVDWKKGILRLVNNNYSLENNLGIAYSTLKSKEIKLKGAEAINAMGNDAEMTVYYQYDKRSKQLFFLSHLVPEGADIKETVLKDNEYSDNRSKQEDEEGGSNIDNISMYEPPQNISREHENAEEGAFSPYNFVTIPSKPVKAKLFDENTSYYSGNITCALTNLTPLFIRNGHLGNGTESDGQFFHLGSEENPAIPATSLKGVLRSIIEAATGNGYDRVERRHFFMRDMSRGNSFTRLFLNIANHSYIVKAGFLHKRNERYYIQPAEWAKVAISDLPGNMQITSTSVANFTEIDKKTFASNNGRRIYFSSINPDGRITINNTMYLTCNLIEGFDPKKGPQTGRLVYSGPMNSKNHEAVFYNEEINQNGWLVIDKNIVELYKKDLTDFKEKVFGKEFDIPAYGIPVFYLTKKNTRAPYFFGRVQMFRVPYTYNLKSYIPEDFKGEKRDSIENTFFCERLFGSLNIGINPKESIALKGRVSVSVGKYAGKLINNTLVNELPEYLVETPEYLKILNEPKPSSYQLYLDQGKGRRLADYFTDPKTRHIAGRKFYWHKPGSDIFNSDVSANIQTLTKAKPLAPDHQFIFDIYFDGLTKVEIGALVWALNPWEESAWKIGQGKPLGMGSAKISIDSFNATEDNARRYQSILPFVKEMASDLNKDDCIMAFKEFLKNYYSTDFETLDHIKDLKALLDWTKLHENVNHKQYMDINNNQEKKLWTGRNILPKARDFYQ